MGQSFSQEVSLAAFNNYSKLSFDISKIKKPEKVKSAYHIPSEEIIVAYMKSNNLIFKLIGLTIDGIVITDQALYLPTSNTRSTNRFPFDEICKYFIYMENQKGIVFLGDASNKTEILGSTLIQENHAGADIVLFVRSLQSILMQTYSWAKEQNNAAVTLLLKASREAMKTKRIPADYLFLLHCVDSASCAYSEVKLVQAEDLYRSCDEDAYKNLLNEVSDDIKSNILQKQNAFIKTFKEDLSDIYHHFEPSFLEEANKNLGNCQSLSIKQLLPAAYIYIRLNENEKYKKICSQLTSVCGIDTLQAVEAFRCCYRNRQMADVFQAIRYDKDFHTEWANWTDSIGLTPLHYAMILKKSSLVEQLLKNYPWDKGCLSEDSAIQNLSSYITLASLLNLPNQENILQETSDIIKAQLRSQQAIERKLWLLNRKLDLQNTAYSNARRTIRNAERMSTADSYEQAERISDAKEKIEHLSEAIQTTKEQIRDTESILSDIQREISDQICKLYSSKQQNPSIP